MLTLPRYAWAFVSFVAIAFNSAVCALLFGSSSMCSLCLMYPFSFVLAASLLWSWVTNPVWRKEETGLRSFWHSMALSVYAFSAWCITDLLLADSFPWFLQTNLVWRQSGGHQNRSLTTFAHCDCSYLYFLGLMKCRFDLKRECMRKLARPKVCVKLCCGHWSKLLLSRQSTLRKGKEIRFDPFALSEYANQAHPKVILWLLLNALPWQPIQSGEK